MSPERGSREKMLHSSRSQAGYVWSHHVTNRTKLRGVPAPLATGDRHVFRFSLIMINCMCKRYLIRQRRQRRPWFCCFVRDLRSLMAAGARKCVMFFMSSRFRSFYCPLWKLTYYHHGESMEMVIRGIIICPRKQGEGNASIQLEP